MNTRCAILLLMCCGVAVLSLPAGAGGPHRTTLSLNGTWEVEDSVGANEMPTAYHHTAPVPGLAHSAVPAFPDVDQYQSRQLLSNLVRQGIYSQADYDKLGNTRGISHQQRNYFWYQKTFERPRRPQWLCLR